MEGVFKQFTSLVVLCVRQFTIGNDMIQAFFYVHLRHLQERGARNIGVRDAMDGIFRHNHRFCDNGKEEVVYDAGQAFVQHKASGHR